MKCCKQFEHLFCHVSRMSLQPSLILRFGVALLLLRNLQGVEDLVNNLSSNTQVLLVVETGWLQSCREVLQILQNYSYCVKTPRKPPFNILKSRMTLLKVPSSTCRSFFTILNELSCIGRMMHILYGLPIHQWSG